MNVLVLFAGAGLSTRGLLDAGHQCTDVEIDPIKSHLSKLLNPDAKHIVSDVMALDMEWVASFDAVWASPPCQLRSDMNKSKYDDAFIGNYERHEDLLSWSLNLPNDILWVENVVSRDFDNSWGIRFNAAQFESIPRQLRSRIIGGRYKMPFVYREYKPYYRDHNICPTILASEGEGGYTPKFKRAQGFYGRKLSIRECAYHQGIDIPDGLLQSWFYPLAGYSHAQWKQQLFEGIGNGVPVYMARAFGDAYNQQQDIALNQLSLSI